ncbi:MAG: hypothetical protein ACSLE3_10570 [Microbacteriaceae bacterium]
MVSAACLDPGLPRCLLASSSAALQGTLIMFSERRVSVRDRARDRKPLRVADTTQPKHAEPPQ